MIAVGEEKSLLKAAPKNIKVYIDLTNFHSRQITDAEVHADVPPDINVLEISPPTVTVEPISP